MSWRDDQAREIEKDARERRALALDIWRRACPINGTPAEAYLRVRGITAPLPPSLRFAAELKHGPTGRFLPALVAGVCDTRRKVTGVWRIWIAKDSAGIWRKAPVSPAKMGLGPTAGGAVRLSPLSTPGGGGPASIAVTEGIETGLSVLSALPQLTVWAALSTSGIVALEVPQEVGEVVVYADNDPPGLAAAGKAIDRLHAMCIRARVVVPPRAGQDFNDVLLAEDGGFDQTSTWSAQGGLDE